MEKVKKTDKRSLRTRSLIKRAVIIQLKTKRPDEIGISEVTKLATVSRNSFYTHYNCINDVLDDVFSDIITQFDNIINKYSYNDFVSEPYHALKEMSYIIINNSAFSKHVVFSKNSNLFVQRLIDTLTEKFYQIYLQTRGVSYTNVEYLISFLVAGCIEFLYKWFKDSNNVNFDEVLTQISLLVKDGIVMIRTIKNQLEKA